MECMFLQIRKTLPQLSKTVLEKKTEKEKALVKRYCPILLHVPIVYTCKQVKLS